MPDQEPPSGAAAKRRLRAALLARRAARDPSALVRAGRSLAAVATAQEQLATAGRVCGYVGVGTEPDTGPLLAALRGAGATMLLPVLAPESGLDWAPYDGPEALVAGPYGLWEPTGRRLGADAAVDADLLLLPALAVDVRGYRLGRGGGYYDRLLARLAATGNPTRPTAWAVVYDDEVLEALPFEPHDVPVDGALTPGGFRRLPAG